ncbi:MAG: alpha-galactosidase [Candidatus Solibacter usitatus]|nr:alpha-galactosidase [Candidatus Solibacter usitatus]
MLYWVIHWLLLSPVLAVAAGPFAFRYDPANQRWTLNNGGLEAVFSLSTSGVFAHERLTNLDTGDSWRASPQNPSSPIRLTVGGAIYGPRTQYRLVSQSAAAIPRDGYRQTIVLEDFPGQSRITLDLEMFAGQPVLRHAVSFVNLRPETVSVNFADMLPWIFRDENEQFRVFRVNQWDPGGARAENFETASADLPSNGRSFDIFSGTHGRHCGWVALRDSDNRGLFAGWEFNGRARAQVRQTRAAGTLQLAASVLELHHPVDPNQEFRVPASFIGLFRGGFDEAGFRTQRFAEAALAKPAPAGGFPYVVWDSWGYALDIEEQTLRANAETAARLGAELFIVDLGWALRLGDWQADPAKFPSGLRALSAYVHSLGMKFGLHFAFAEAAADSQVLRDHPDWTSSENGNYFGGHSLCLAHRPVRDWVIQQALRMIDDYAVDWILQDGEDMVKQCTKTTHTHDPADSNYANSVEGLDAVLAEVQRLRPNTYWENCENGGNMMTFQMVRNYVTSITNDASGALSSRQAAFGVTYPFPPRYSDRYMPEQELTPYVTRSFMFGGPWIVMNRTLEMSPESLELAASEIALYKGMRDLIRDGKVFHLTPRPAQDRIDAIESYNAAADSALVIVSRPLDPDDFYLLKPRGLRPDNTYRVRFQDDVRTYTMTGAQLASEGVRVELPEPFSAEIVYISPI